MRNMQLHPKAARGFTLIEISVALLLVGLLLGAAIPAVQAVAATQLKKSVGQLAGMTREAYARSAISGKPHRIVMDLDEGSFWLEVSSGAFVLEVEKNNQLTEAELNTRKQDKLKKVLSVAKADVDERDRLKEELARGPSWSAVDDELGQHQKLPADCAFEKVWVAHQAEAFQRGQALLHFWPSGRTESAVIRLTDDPESLGRIISIKVNGLTGRTQIQDRAMEFPRQ